MPVDPSESLLSKFFKKKKTKDIELPNESGKVDQRLPRVAFEKAAKGFKELQRRNILFGKD